MDFISECFNKHDNTFKKKLKSAGYSAEQIRLFMPELESGLKATVQKSGADNLITGLISEGPTELLNAINIGSIATRLGINHGQVIVGINAVTPVLTQALKQSTNGLVSAAASLAWGTTGQSINKNKS